MVFLSPTLFFFTVVEQVQMWLTAVDYPFLWAYWMLAGNKKGRGNPALFHAVRDESASILSVSLRIG